MRIPRYPLAACLVVTLGSATFASNAVITPVSQVRTVSGSASAGDSIDFDSDSDSASAPDFGLFNVGAGANASVSNGLGSGGGSQNSQILPTSILMSGSSFAVGEGWDFDSFGDGSGSSSASVTFTIDCTVEFTYSGTVGGFDSGGSFTSLTGPGGVIFSIGDPGNDEASFDQSGVLTPGEYTLNASTSGSAFGGGGFPGYASGSFDVALQLAGPSVPTLPDAARAGLVLVLALAGFVALRGARTAVAA